MNKLKNLILLLLALTVTLPVKAQLSPAVLVRPGFPTVTGLVDMTALQTSMYAAARDAGIIARAQLAQEAAKANLVKGVFRAYPQGQTDTRGYSGFIFKTTYQGREEIFGVIAQHAMPAWNSRGQVGQSFTARVVKGDQVVDIPAEVVQVSALSMPDIALVKFHPKDEKELTPLTLATQEPALNEPLQVLGFGKGQLAMITDSPLLKNSPLNLRFPMGGDPGEWPGLCGSPVLNSAGEVVGTMTGAARKNATIVSHVDANGVSTVTETPADPYHTGYATRNLYLRALVGAYHNDPEQSTFPFMLGEHKIVDLEADEFVSMIILRDERMKTIFRKAIQHKFSYATIMEHLPEARYVELYIEKAWWSGAGLVEGGNILKARYVAYDLQEKEIVEDRKRSDF